MAKTKIPAGRPDRWKLGVTATGKKFHLIRIGAYNMQFTLCSRTIDIVSTVGLGNEPICGNCKRVHEVMYG